VALRSCRLGLETSATLRGWNALTIQRIPPAGEKSSGYKPPMFITEENKNYEEGMGL